MVTQTIFHTLKWKELDGAERLTALGLEILKRDERKIRKDPAVIRAKIFPNDDYMSVARVQQILESLQKAGYITIEETQITLNEELYGEARKVVRRREQQLQLPAVETPATPEEKQTLALLAQIPNYPHNTTLDLTMVRALKRDYPQKAQDLNDIIKGWTTWLNDQLGAKVAHKPNKYPVNFRNSLRNRIENQVRWEKEKPVTAEIDKPKVTGGWRR